jgi:endonuclease YncB( thermonuclease family)
MPGFARLNVESQGVNRRMVANGLAWRSTPYSKNAAMADAENVALATQRGLWAD